METQFYLVFSEREDGQKVWTARCLGCDAQLVGERSPAVVLLGVKGDVPPAQFETFKQTVRRAWDEARKSGSPIVYSNNMLNLAEVHTHGDLQRALEAHVCQPK